MALYLLRLPGRPVALLISCFSLFAISAAGQQPTATPKTAPPENVSTDKKDSAQSNMKVTFDENSPGVIYVESNGEKIRVDTTKKTVETVAGESSTNETSATAAAPDKTTDDQTESKYDFDRGEEPYDYRVVDIPTPKSIPKGSWTIVFTHRFSEPVRPVRDSARDLLGLDSFGIASFGLTYGVTDKFYLSAYRSPLCQRGLCKTIEIGAGYNWIAADKDSPIGLSTYASVEGNDNFTEEYTYNLQAMLSGRVGKRLYLFFSPAVHINSNGQRRFDPRPTDFFPPAAIAETFRQPTHGASFGFGASFLITPNVAALFDYVPRTGFKLGRVRPVFNGNFQITGFTTESHPTLGFGIERNIGKHAFSLTFSNTQGTTTSRYNSSTLFLKPKHFIIGFNLSRRF
jgi:hypothetical protein